MSQNQDSWFEKNFGSHRVRHAPPVLNLGKLRYCSQSIGLGGGRPIRDWEMSFLDLECGNAIFSRVDLVD